MSDINNYAEWPWSIEKDWDYFQDIDLSVKPNYEKKSFNETDLYRGVNSYTDDFFAHFNIYGQGWRHISECFLAPYESGSILLTEKGKEIISSALNQQEADFFPVSVSTESGANFNCWFLVPKFRTPCTDINATSGIKWLVPDNIILYFDRMKFTQNCLGEKNIVRNSHFPSQILFSFKIIKAIEKSNLKGAKFIFGPYRDYYKNLLWSDR